MEFSQHLRGAALTMESVSDTASFHRALSSGQRKRTEGIALVVVLLSAMVLMVSMLAISATMAISSQRTTADQSAMLQAQYAAESGLALAKTRNAEAFVLFSLISVPTNTTMSTLKTAAVDFCGKAFTDVNRLTLTTPVTVCDAKPTNGGTAPASRTYTFFANYISSTAVDKAIEAATDDAKEAKSTRDVNTIYLNSYAGLTSTAAKTAFWRDIFSGNAPRSSISLPAPATGVTAAYTPSYGFIPHHIDAIPGGFRLFFTPVKATSKATLKAGSTTVSTRTLTEQPAMPMFSLDVARQCFCQYNYFSNRRLLNNSILSLIGGGSGKLGFGADEKFYGRVHINANTLARGAAYFIPDSSTVYPHFYGGFSTAAPDRYWWSTNYDNSISKEAMFHGNYNFNSDIVDMPENAASQKSAVIGNDPETTTTVTDTNLATAYGKNTSNFYSGVYYGNGQQKGNSWKGGIYVRGNVSDLKLTTTSTTPNKQVITVTQIPCPTTAAKPYCITKSQNLNTNFTKTVTTFTQNASGSWTMTEQVGTATATTTPISAGFNGLVYVDGNIGSGDSQIGGDSYSTGGLGGEGTGDSSVSRNLVNGVDHNNSRSYETPDIAKDMRITVAARDDIYIKRNLTYTDTPRDDDPNTLADESTSNMLGIYSEKGNIKVDGVRNKAIKLDASLMAVGSDPNSKLDTGDDGKGFGTIDFHDLTRSTSGSRPNIELTGGIIEEQSQGVARTTSSWGSTSRYGYDRDFDYDPRFASGKTPPFFPTQGQYTSACYEIIASTYNASLQLPNVLRPCTRNIEGVWNAQKG